jgi:hypothetical protein
MNAPRDPDRLIHAFLMEGQTELADQVYDAVRASIDRTHQRVVIGPWRLPAMNKVIPIGLGAAAVIAVAVGPWWGGCGAHAIGIAHAEPIADSSGRNRPVPA